MFETVNVSVSLRDDENTLKIVKQKNDMKIVVKNRSGAKVLSDGIIVKDSVRVRYFTDMSAV